MRLPRIPVVSAATDRLVNSLDGSYDVRGKVVLITGGAKGIGAETARMLADQGARLALTDVDATGLEVFAAELAAGGADVGTWVADVTDLAAMETATAAIVKRFGRVDVVIANAGIAGVSRTVRTVDPDIFKRVIDVNVMGVWHTVRASIEEVVRNDGYILVVASLAAIVPLPFNAAYGASKGAVEMFGRALELELVDTGAKVGVAYFGFIETPLVHDVFDDPGAQHMRKQMPGFIRSVAPVSEAASAIVKGIGHRSRTVYAPRWLPALMTSKHTAGWVLKAGAGRIRGKVTEAEQLSASAAPTASRWG